MAVNAFISNQGTQTSILTDNTGGTAGTVIPVMKVSMDGQGTYTDANLFQGTLLKINTIGTIPNTPGGTINLATIAGNLGTIGTIGLATVSGNVGISSGTINVSTISSMPNVPGGTINLATITGNLGTIGTIGLATVSGNVGISSGTVNVSTISSIPNIPGGTLDVVTSLRNGSIMMTAGTVSAGTINTGTFSLTPLSGVVLAGTLGVGTTATALPATPLSNRKSMIVYNEGTVTFYLGGSGVTTSTGIPVGTADFSPSFDLGTTILYGICGTVGGTARVLEVS